MTRSNNGQRPTRKAGVATHAETTRLASTVRKRLAAGVNQIAHPVAKRAAARLVVTPRTTQRWRSPDYAHTSPLCKVLEAIDAAEDPMVIVEVLEAAHYRAVARLRDKSTPKLVADYRKILADDAEHEGADNKHKVARGLDWLERCIGSVVDATDDRSKAAHELEFAYRGLSESEVFDG